MTDNALSLDRLRAKKKLDPKLVPERAQHSGGKM